MGLEFLDRVRTAAIVSGVVVVLAASVYLGLPFAGAFALGCAWSLVNLYVIRVLVRLALFDPQKHQLQIAAVMFFKIPALYGIGFLLLWCGWFPAIGLLAGFGWPLLIVFLKAGGRLLLGLDNPKSLFSGPGNELE
ncbi:MAG: hypothetical protein JSW50_14245 [Candidatus Latescibacterota bacterium]|nr:MAG: hypothetical protein JSW50_14245 [Candidatus Latescibacterota bacterium]